MDYYKMKVLIHHQLRFQLVLEHMIIFEKYIYVMSLEKNMKKKELAKKNKADLQKELDEKRVAVHTIRFGQAGSKSKNVKEQKNIKKDIARILTALKSSTK